MLNEVKILFNNIENFRQLLTEGVSDKLLVDAINNYRYLHIYYDGDDSNATGWRTIRPYRLGLLQSKTENNGHLALRAWQERGDSESQKYGDSKGRHRDYHEYWSEQGGVPGWRLFLVHNIMKAYPTGLRFVDHKGKPLIPPKYRADGDMYIPSAIAHVSVDVIPKDQEEKPLGSIVAPAIMSKDGKEPIIAKGRLTKEILVGLHNYAVNIRKEKLNSFIITLDNLGNYRLRKATRKSLPRNERLIGGLDTLYYKRVKPPQTNDPEADKFIEKQKQKTLKDLQVQKVKENIKNSPIERKTFFK